MNDGSFEVVDETCLELEKLVEKWDPDFVKLTPEEQERLDEADIEMKNGIYVTEEEMWVLSTDNASETKEVIQDALSGNNVGPFV